VAKAQADLDKAIELDSNSIYHLWERAAIFTRLKRHKEAIKDSYRILDIDSANADAMSVLGYAFIELGDKVSAVSWYKKALIADHVHKKAILGLGLLYEHVNEYENAIHFYSKFLRLDSTDSYVWFRRCKVFSFTNEWERAFSDINRALLIDSTAPTLLLNRGIILAHRGDTVDALNDLDRILRIDPAFVDAYIFKGRISLSRSNTDAAQFDFASALLHSKNQARTHYFIGVAKLECDAFAEAVEDFRRSIDLAPQIQDPYLGLANCYMGLKDKKAACKSFLEALKRGHKETEGAREKYCD
jgi:tetratricopeptide (TPR) repeat protein